MMSVYIFYRFVNIKKGIIWIRTEMERIRHVKKSPEFQQIWIWLPIESTSRVI